MIELKNIEYSVAEKAIIKNFNLLIQDGERLTIAGPSGTGKSTILKMIAKIISPTAGKILLNQEDISEIESSTYRKRVSYCFQQPVLFGETVEDNFKFVFDIRNQNYDKDKITETLNDIKLDESILSQKITDVSGGERQRIALARNTIFMPEVLLLDEVTTGLDTENKATILSWLDQLSKQQNVTMISVTHDESELTQSQNTIRIEQGGIIHE